MPSATTTTEDPKIYWANDAESVHETGFYIYISHLLLRVKHFYLALIKLLILLICIFLCGYGLIYEMPIWTQQTQADTYIIKMETVIKTNVMTFSHKETVLLLMRRLVKSEYSSSYLPALDAACLRFMTA
jgi:hypothetical protein